MSDQPDTAAATAAADAAVSSSTTETAPSGPKPDAGPPPRFEVKKWNAVALWSWDIQVDTCAICRMHLMDLCVECQSQGTATVDDCSVAWGACNHPFHFHCISRWVKTRMTCPLDNREWVFHRYGR
jgi:RING-box protein 1